MLTIHLFVARLRAHGAALDTWPPPIDDQARRLLARSLLARIAYRRALQAEATIEVVIDDPVAMARMQAGLQRRLAASVARPAPPVRMSMRWGAVAACFVAGVMIGLAGIIPGPVPPADSVAELHISPILLDAR